MHYLTDYVTEIWYITYIQPKPVWRKASQLTIRFDEYLTLSQHLFLVIFDWKSRITNNPIIFVFVIGTSTSLFNIFPIEDISNFSGPLTILKSPKRYLTESPNQILPFPLDRMIAFNIETLFSFMAKTKVWQDVQDYALARKITLIFQAKLLGGTLSQSQWYWEMSFTKKIIQKLSYSIMNSKIGSLYDREGIKRLSSEKKLPRRQLVEITVNQTEKRIWKWIWNI